MGRGILYSLTAERPPHNNSCPHSDGTGERKTGSLCTSGVWATQPASESLPVPPSRLPADPSILASPLFLFLPTAVCSARQNNVRRGPDRRPKPPWTNCFHLRPTFLDDALTNRVGRQLCPKMKRNYTKQVQRKGTDWSFDLLLGTLRPLFCLNA